MKQKQIRIDGSVDTPISHPPPKRNADGSLPEKYLHAIRWYMVSFGMKPAASNAWPIFYFKDREGHEVTANISTILEEYEDFKRSDHGKRQAAA